MLCQKHGFRKQNHKIRKKRNTHKNQKEKGKRKLGASTLGPFASSDLDFCTVIGTEILSLERIVPGDNLDPLQVFAATKNILESFFFLGGTIFGPDCPYFISFH